MRQRSSADGRGQVAVLSDEGYVRLRAAVRTKRADLQALLFEGLTEHEIHTLAEVFAKVRQRLDDRYEAVTP